MGEPLKKDAPKAEPQGIRVLALTTQEGGVDVAGKVVKYISTERPDTVWAHAEVDMRLDRNLGGVVIRYVHKAVSRTVLVPLAHCQRIELVEG